MGIATHIWLVPTPTSLTSTLPLPACIITTTKKMPAPPAPPYTSRDLIDAPLPVCFPASRLVPKTWALNDGQSRDHLREYHPAKERDEKDFKRLLAHFPIFCQYVLVAIFLGPAHNRPPSRFPAVEFFDHALNTSGCYPIARQDEALRYLSARAAPLGFSLGDVKTMLVIYEYRKWYVSKAADLQLARALLVSPGFTRDFDSWDGEMQPFKLVLARVLDAYEKYVVKSAPFPVPSESEPLVNI